MFLFLGIQVLSLLTGGRLFGVIGRSFLPANRAIVIYNKWLANPRAGETQWFCPVDLQSIFSNGTTLKELDLGLNDAFMLNY